MKVHSPVVHFVGFFLSAVVEVNELYLSGVPFSAALRHLPPSLPADSTISNVISGNSHLHSYTNVKGGD